MIHYFYQLKTNFSRFHAILWRIHVKVIRLFHKSTHKRPFLKSYMKKLSLRTKDFSIEFSVSLLNFLLLQRKLENI